MTYGRATEDKIREVRVACDKYGQSSIVALAGVPGTGKSFVASIAAQRLATTPEMVRELQFHPSFSYEEFIEGMRLDTGGGVSPKPGVFVEWNQLALDDPDNKYVILIEELTRGNLPSLLGELLTYIEYRDRPFLTMYGRSPTYVANNLTIIATYNPTDRSALELDNALIRRLRIVQCHPDADQLAEMLDGRGIRSEVIQKLQGLFKACESEFPEEYEHLMPFGHGIFSEVRAEAPDLFELWHDRLKHLLRRPLLEPHKFTGVIERNYPWKTNLTYTVPPSPATGISAAAHAAPAPAEGAQPAGPAAEGVRSA